MQSPSERKKTKLSRTLLLSSALIKKYDELYKVYCESGYTKELCDSYASAFVDDIKKPASFDIIQTARLYDKIYDYKNACFYLDMLSDKKLGNEDRFDFCTEMLKNYSKRGKWRDAEDFRTENISFMQTYAEKIPTEKQADMYIALALADCSAKKYNEAFTIIKNFGYRPKGTHDVHFMEMLITGIYICACEDNGEVRNAVQNAESYLKLMNSFEFDWCPDYYRKRIENASKRLI